LASKERIEPIDGICHLPLYPFSSVFSNSSRASLDRQRLFKRQYGAAVLVGLHVRDIGLAVGYDAPAYCAAAALAEMRGTRFEAPAFYGQIATTSARIVMSTSLVLRRGAATEWRFTAG
jgi:hypothetical protein